MKFQVEIPEEALKDFKLFFGAEDLPDTKLIQLALANTLEIAEEKIKVEHVG